MRQNDVRLLDYVERAPHSLCTVISGVDRDITICPDKDLKYVVGNRVAPNHSLWNDNFVGVIGRRVYIIDQSDLNAINFRSNIFEV